ncbi:MoxR family ATPase [Acidimicrobiaceae bacterium]|jgi:MoxR-like ATPase|nr:MoxR family ATPase [Acidimicrobiaceae bacterium]MDC3226803.1 MoxR family ATPase [Acidimicrobiaceae bacterium]
MNKDLSVKDLESVNYFSNENLVDVINAAIFLKKPLLIEGPAGTGKTFLAKAISSFFNLELIRLQCHEGIDEDKAVYEWNYKKQLLSIQQDKNAENLFDESYLIKRPILNALTSEKESLFLIDEIDRSDEEFEALLLEILAENQVTIPEFGTINGSDNRITILTSNGTRELSDALKRRCLYFYLDFPSVEIESKVLMNSISEISEEQARTYASFISYVRNLNLNKIPSLIESVEWVKYNLINKNKSNTDNLGILLKDKSDQEKYKEQIENTNELIQE